MSVLSYMMPALVSVVLLSGVWLFLKYSRFTKGSVLPAESTPASWKTRLPELIVILILAIACFHQYAIEPLLGGVLLSRGALAVAVVLPAVLILSGRTPSAMLVLGCLWIGSSFVEPYVRAQWQEDRPDSHAPGGVFGPIEDQKIVFRVTGVDVTGADLWINGVHLGQTPVELAFEELLDRIPDWEDVPLEELTEEAQERTRRGNYGISKFSAGRRWARARLPENSFRLPEHVLTRVKNRKSKDIYIRVRLNGEDGVRGGGAGMGQTNEGPIRAEVQFEFPGRQKRLQTLLQQARLANYEVKATWFEAIEGFNDDGWMAVRELLPHEPGFARVMDQWAEWKYGISVPTGGQRDLFKLADHVDEMQEYDTGSVTGWAVMRLASHMSPGDLIDELCSRMPGHKRAVRETRTIAGERYFRWLPTDQWFSAGNEQQDLKVSTALLGHAAWEWLKSHDSNTAMSQQVRDELAAALVQHQFGHDDAVMLALNIGGPALDRYVIGKTRQADLHSGGGNHWDNRLHWMHTGDINKWWYYAAQLNSPGGQRFRDQRNDQLLQIASAICSSSMLHPFRIERVQFLFMEHDSTRTSPAARFWPQFQANVDASHVSQPVNMKFNYLVKAEPALPTSEYVSVWLTSSYGHDATSALKSLAPLPVSRRIEVLDAFSALLGETCPFTGEDWSNWDSEREQLRRSIDKARYLQIDDSIAAKRIVHDLLIEDSSSRGRLFSSNERFISWLAEHVSERPQLLDYLVNAEDPQLRRLAIPALRQHATPEYRRLLSRLARDDDESVRSEAMDVQKYWEDLATQSLTVASSSSR